MKHFEFTGETKIFLGVTLRRIRATVTFTLACGLTVHKGDEGGWIEKESNLCENAWVSGNARVYGDAFLSRPDHLMEIGKIGSRFDTTTFFRNKEGIIKVTCGCFYGSIAEFRAKVQQTHGENKFAKVYMAAAALAELQIDVSPVEDETEGG